MTDLRRCPTAPPEGFEAKLLTTPFGVSSGQLVRIYWDGRDPLQFSRSTQGKRFDPLASPWASTQVLYAGDCLEIAIAETLLRWHGKVLPDQPVLLSVSEQLEPRRVARFVPTRTLTVIDATGLGLKAIEEALALCALQRALPYTHAQGARRRHLSVLRC